MRTFIALPLAMLAVLACTPALERTAIVTFSTRGVASGDLPTKGVSDAVLGAVSASAPSLAPYITLTSKSNPARTYEVRTGAPYTVAVDSYSVTGVGGGSASLAIYQGKVYPEFRYSVSDDITVGDEGGEFELAASYSCFAVVFDKSAVASVSFLDSGGRGWSEPSFVGGDADYGVYFLSGSWGSANPLRAVFTPKDDVNFESTTISLGYSGCEVNVSNGRWYLFSPAAVSVTSGEFGVSLPEWVAGN